MTNRITTMMATDDGKVVICNLDNRGSIQYSFSDEDILFETYHQARSYGKSMVDIGFAKDYNILADGAKLTIKVILK